VYDVRRATRPPRVSRGLLGRQRAYAFSEEAMSASARQRMITLHDGARVALRPITPADKPHLAASFERLRLSR
jgi:hypothetical protein